MRRVPDEIAASVLDWVDEKVPTVDGPPCINAKVELEAVHEFLIGPMRDSGGPTSGTRTYSMDIKFRAVDGTKQAEIDQLLVGLRWAADEESQIAGLPNGGRLFLGDEKVEGPSEHRDPSHYGPIVTFAAAVRVSE